MKSFANGNLVHRTPAILRTTLTHFRRAPFRASRKTAAAGTRRNRKRHTVAAGDSTVSSSSSCCIGALRASRQRQSSTSAEARVSASGRAFRRTGEMILRRVIVPGITACLVERATLTDALTSCRCVRAVWGGRLGAPRRCLVLQPVRVAHSRSVHRCDRVTSGGSGRGMVGDPEWVLATTSLDRNLDGRGLGSFIESSPRRTSCTRQSRRQRLGLSRLVRDLGCGGGLLVTRASAAR
jgi:hypothetical protein